MSEINNIQSFPAFFYFLLDFEPSKGILNDDIKLMFPHVLLWSPNLWRDPVSEQLRQTLGALAINAGSR